MGKYILYRTWWQEIEQASISQVVFISAETPAFACIDAGMAAVEYRQHGLHRKSILMPAFRAVENDYASRGGLVSDSILPQSRDRSVTTKAESLRNIGPAFWSRPSMRCLGFPKSKT